MRDGTAEPVSRDQILRYAVGQGNIIFPCSAGHEQDWQPYPFDPYSAICDDHTEQVAPRQKFARPPKKQQQRGLIRCSAEQNKMFGPGG